MFDDFVPEAWRWRLPKGEDGTGRWKVVPSWESHMDFALSSPLNQNSLPASWAARTQYLLNHLDFDIGSASGLHAEALPDFSGPDDFPQLQFPWNESQLVLGNLGGLWQLDCTPEQWRAGTPVTPWAPTKPKPGWANDRESIAENIVIEADGTTAVPWAEGPYPTPILVTSPRNQPDSDSTEPPDPTDPHRPDRAAW